MPLAEQREIRDILETHLPQQADGSFYNQVVVSDGNVQVSLTSTQSLDNDEWLIDEIIAFMIKCIIQPARPRIGFFSSHFPSWLLGTSCQQGYAGIRWCRQVVCPNQPGQQALVIHPHGHKKETGRTEQLQWLERR